MTIAHQAHRDRIDAELGFEWDCLPQIFDSALDVTPDASSVRLRRVGTSHRGVSKLSGVRRLWAYGVNQDFLAEIGELQDLEVLYLEKVTASELGALSKLPRLRSLSVIDASRVADLSWVPAQSLLRSLAIVNAKNLTDIGPLSRLKHLNALAVEGGTWTPMRVSSLSPVSSLLQLQYLFLTNLRVADGSLIALHSLQNLRVLQCARFFSRDEFVHLSHALPSLRCDWFSEQHWKAAG